jgi:hypothetical protein
MTTDSVRLRIVTELLTRLRALPDVGNAGLDPYGLPADAETIAAHTTRHLAYCEVFVGDDDNQTVTPVATERLTVTVAIVCHLPEQRASAGKAETIAEIADQLYSQLYSTFAGPIPETGPARGTFGGLAIDSRLVSGGGLYHGQLGPELAVVLEIDYGHAEGDRSTQR